MSCYSIRLSDDLKAADEGLLREAGHLDYFRVFGAAASGPTCLASLGFDFQLLNHLQGCKVRGDRWLLGASTAALRFCAILSSLVSPTKDSPSLTTKLKDHFISMTYKHGYTPSTLQPMMEALIKTVLPPHLVQRVLSHDSLHLAVIVVKVKPPFDRLPEWPWLNLVFWILLAINWILPRVLNSFQEVLCFYTGRNPPEFITNNPKNRGIAFHSITEANVYQVLRATTSLPFYSPQVRWIEGVGAGLYYDGALAHYGMSIESTSSYPVLLIGDGPDESIKRNLWDSYVWGRNLPLSFFKHITLVHPNKAFLKKLDTKRIPAVFDYFKSEYIADPELRKKHWRQAYELSVSGFPSLNQLIEFSSPIPSGSRESVLVEGIQSLIPLLSQQGSNSSGSRKKAAFKLSKSISFTNPFDWVHSRNPSVEDLAD